ncbi:MAG: CehA/McbA family metallohydrolase [Candidatus Bathyarchaeota archaeon]|nr:CehA/McbA family metallohydrolase [Candidatus Bathyarchaeota archaeon]
MPLKFDLHVHTCYSGDSSITLEDLIVQIKAKGLNGVAVTDHDTVKGAVKAVKAIEAINGGNKSGRLMVIPGVEVSTKQGHILGINVKTPIKPGLGVGETVERIHDAGGIAIAAHPQAFFKKGVGLNKKIISYGLDAIEVINSLALPFGFSRDKCRNFARECNLPQTAGSDSHIPEAIGLAYTVISGCDESIDGIVESIRRGLTEPLGKGIPMSLRLRHFLRIF